ncbi:MAG: hypothetical protein CM1200mP18_02300 [Gammaproteobacteria bacterium]|nr:MAG: hypothetical protein CM1200mP18_02300 [Gammaproteobacteria bacterium]
MLDGGLAFDEGMKIGEILTNSGLIDFISVIRGHIETSAGLADVIPNMGRPGRRTWRLPERSNRHLICL